MSDNIAGNKFVDASGSVFPYTPAKAVDGTVTALNRWVGSSPLPPEPVTPAPNWLRVDLGAFYWVNRWVVKQMGAVGWSSNYNLTDYRLQGSSDNANWFDIDSVVNNSANQTDRTAIPKNARWVRVYVTKGLRYNTNFSSIVDLEIYEASNAPYLSGLAVQSGAMNVGLNPGFSGKTYSYTSNVDGTVGTITVTPTAATVGLTIKVNGTVTVSGQPSQAIQINGGNNLVTVEVTSPDNLMRSTYSINVIKPSKSAYLSNLVVNGIRGMINPTFNSNTFNYTANTAGGVTSVTVTPTAADNEASIKVNANVVASGQTSPPISLIVGQTSITTEVVAADGSDTKVYTVVVTRPS